MNELRIYVEQIVRPILATKNRKLQLREELYAHLEEQFNLDLEKSQDERQAFSQAVNRFGASDQLTDELQQTISRPQRLFGWFEMWLKREEDESLFFFAGRISLLTILSSILYGVFLILLIHFFSSLFFSEGTMFKNLPDKLVDRKWFMGATLICLGFNTFTFTCIANITFNRCKTQPIRISVLVSLLAGLLCALSFVSSIWMIFLAFLEDPLFTSELTLHLSLSFLWIPILFSFAMQAACWEWHKFAPWESLKLPVSDHSNLIT